MVVNHTDLIYTTFKPFSLNDTWMFIWTEISTEIEIDCSKNI